MGLPVELRAARQLRVPYRVVFAGVGHLIGHSASRKPGTVHPRLSFHQIKKEELAIHSGW